MEHAWFVGGCQKLADKDITLGGSPSDVPPFDSDRDSWIAQGRVRYGWKTDPRPIGARCVSQNHKSAEGAEPGTAVVRTSGWLFVAGHRSQSLTLLYRRSGRMGQGLLWRGGGLRGTG